VWSAPIRVRSGVLRVQSRSLASELAKSFFPIRQHGCARITDACVRIREPSACNLATLTTWNMLLEEESSGLPANTLGLVGLGGEAAAWLCLDEKRFAPSFNRILRTHRTDRAVTIRYPLRMSQFAQGTSEYFADQPSGSLHWLSSVRWKALDIFLLP